MSKFQVEHCTISTPKSLSLPSCSLSRSIYNVLVLYYFIKLKYMNFPTTLQYNFTKYLLFICMHCVRIKTSKIYCKLKEANTHFLDNKQQCSYKFQAMLFEPRSMQLICLPTTHFHHSRTELAKAIKTKFCPFTDSWSLLPVFCPP